LVLGVWLATAVAVGGEWPTWRGPLQNGVAPGQGYPTTWSKTENVAWVVDLPGKGASTPVVWKDRIVLTAGSEGQNHVLCYSTAGKLLWQTQVGKEREGKHTKATGANPSVVTDGRQWYAYFKSGDLAALTPEGKIAWQVNLQEKYGEDTLWWDLGTSPVLTRRGVVVAVMQTGPSYLVSFDRETGRELWKHDRNLDAPSEAAQSYSTPLVLETEGQELLVVLGADHVTAHDAADGRELWRVGGLNPGGERFFRSIASPVAAGGLIIAPYARGSTLTAVRRGGSGDVTATHVAWRRSDLGADVPTPAVLDGQVVVCTDGGGIECLEAATGTTLWKEQLPKNRHAYSASPVIAEGRVFATREDGETAIVALPAAGTGAAVVGTGMLDEMTVATPVCVDGRIFLRSRDALWCIAAE